MIRLLFAAALIAAGCAAHAQNLPPPAPFALLGDTPYSQSHANLLEGMIDEINKAGPAFAVHLGDITGGNGPCTDAWLEARARQFARFASPFVLVVGDNEWTDCYRTGFDPLERLAKVRALFHSRPAGLPGFARQSAAYPEHTRWTYGGALFVGLNVPGSNNNLGRTPDMDAEHTARMKAVLAWLDEAVDLAASPDTASLVVLMQANPRFDPGERSASLPDGYAPVRTALVAAARKVGKPLIVAHGDTHRFRHDRPEPAAPNLVRIEVDGWPWMGWVEVRTTPDRSRPVAVARRLYD